MRAFLSLILTALTRPSAFTQRSEPQPDALTAGVPEGAE
jgi:hypothetical protein